MPLLEIWRSNPQEFEAYKVRQVVSFAGDGILADRSGASEEFRSFLTKVESRKIASYVDECLNEKFDHSGFVLQDLINELGRRLDYEVTSGRYRGVKGEIGFDGLWEAPTGWKVILEVKTTDTYRLDLETLARYRSELRRTGSADEHSSILIVVGRNDTGDLEAQIRGSRHAWDIRLISAEAMVKLVQLKEEGDDATADRIRSLLLPNEYTRLDKLIEIVFDTAEDIRTPAEEAVASELLSDVSVVPRRQESNDQEKRVLDRTDQEVVEDIRRSVVKSFASSMGKELLKKSKAQFWSSDKALRACCTISKLHERNSQYWYAYHPSWDDFLGQATSGYLLLGCVGLGIAFAIPHQFVVRHLDKLNTTEREDGRMYWHLHLAEIEDEHFVLKLKGASQTADVSQFALEISPSK